MSCKCHEAVACWPRMLTCTLPSWRNRSAAYWSVGAWNLIAWTMCCCGVPACCLGYKRFPRRPWVRDTATTGY